MQSVTFNAQTCFVLDDVPDWGAAPVSVEATLPSAYERALTGKETRRQTGDTLRLNVKWTSRITDDAAFTSLRNALQTLNVQPVLCPLWVAGFAAGDSPVASASYYALFDADGSFDSIQPPSALPFAKIAYPLLVGRLTESPSPSLESSAFASAKFSFTENDNDFYLTPPVFNAPTGITAASGVRPLFPFAANWVSAPQSGGAETDILWQQIGEGRAMSSVYYNQRNRRRVRQDLVLSGLDGLNLLSFFAQMGGEVESFWLPANLKETFLAADVSASDTTLSVVNGDQLGSNSFISLRDSTRRVLLAVQTGGASTWTLTAPVGADFTAAVTDIESLVLARFDALKLTLTFSAPNWCQCTASFKELPWETAAVSGETIGSTMGPLPTTAMLYTFHQVTPSGTNYWRYTNFERDLTDGDGNVYSGAAIENDDITDSPNLERQSVTVKMRNCAGCPLALLIPFALEFPLMLDIAECDVTGDPTLHGPGGDAIEGVAGDVIKGVGG